MLSYYFLTSTVEAGLESQATDVVVSLADDFLNATNPLWSTSLGVVDPFYSISIRALYPLNDISLGAVFSIKYSALLFIFYVISFLKSTKNYSQTYQFINFQHDYNSWKTPGFN